MTKENRLRKRTQIVIHALKNDIDSNPLKCKKVSDIASEAGIGKKRLEAGFKLLFAITIKQYQILRRLEASQQLLDEGAHTIQEIAYKIGYEQPNSFTKAFKKLYGTTPTDWQNRTGQIQDPQ